MLDCISDNVFSILLSIIIISFMLVIKFLISSHIILLKYRIYIANSSCYMVLNVLWNISKSVRVSLFFLLTYKISVSSRLSKILTVNRLQYHNVIPSLWIQYFNRTFLKLHLSYPLFLHYQKIYWIHYQICKV